MLSLTAGLFLRGTVQTLGSTERLRRYNIQSSSAVQESKFRYHRLFARTRRVTGKELLNAVRNNRCNARLLRGLRLSAHKGLVLDTLVRQYQRPLVM